MTSIFLYCYCILRSIVTLNHRYICSQQTENHRPSTHVIDVATTCHSHIKIMPNILAAHGPSGCDIVSSYFGIGKKTVINMLSKKNIDLHTVSLTIWHHQFLEFWLVDIWIFAHWRHQSAVTRLESVCQLNIRRSRKLGFQLSQKHPLKFNWISEWTSWELAGSWLPHKLEETV